VRCIDGTKRVIHVHTCMYVCNLAWGAAVAHPKSGEKINERPKDPRFAPQPWQSLQNLPQANFDIDS
jgi:hypothetical protein